ncbi:hypothetical protein PPYR_05429 [Photinus pyralis]|uniref:Protein rolling stone n=1 Tax=Photinus pyralis TaxID=7054 RepID=A0A1Y1N4E4_PHOPY|nr:protein rolling stone isoform X2 [Photinus pyralis]KAB0801075.1 hypothetical protein PPYR_05429 [Photinus pyralis]
MGTSVGFRCNSNMLELWKKKFTTAQYSMEYRRPTVFVLSQWQTSSKPTLLYLIYKWAITIFFIVSWVVSIIDIPHLNEPNFNHAKWLIYLTNWGFTMCTIQSLLSTTMVTICYSVPSHDSETSTSQDHKILGLYKVYWVTNIIATDIAFGITIVYWTLLYDAKYVPLSAVNIIVHAFNSVIMFIELCVARHPVRLIHFYWPLIFGGCYICFTIIYYFSGGTGKDQTPAIYPILNWSKGEMTAIVCVVVCVFVVFLHILTYGIFKLRKVFHKKWFQVKDERLSLEVGKDNPISVLPNDLV